MLGVSRMRQLGVAALVNGTTITCELRLDLALIRSPEYDIISRRVNIGQPAGGALRCGALVFLQAFDAPVTPHQLFDLCRGGLPGEVEQFAFVSAVGDAGQGAHLGEAELAGREGLADIGHTRVRVRLGLFLGPRSGRCHSAS